MDWTTILPGAAAAALAAVLPPLIAWLGRQTAGTYAANWAAGVGAAAGRVLIALLQARATGPQADLRAVLSAAVQAEADRVMASYATTVRKIGATRADAESRILGELGRMPEVAALLTPPPELRELVARPIAQAVPYSEAYSAPYPIGMPTVAERLG